MLIIFLHCQIVGLQTGQAIIFAPSGLGVKTVNTFPGAWDNVLSGDFHEKGNGVVTPFGQGYLLVRSRQRITLDGGHSFLAVPKENKRVPAKSETVSVENGTDAEVEHLEGNTAVVPVVSEMVVQEMEGGKEFRDDEVRSEGSDSGFETCAEEDEDTPVAPVPRMEETLEATSSALVLYDPGSSRPVVPMGKLFYPYPFCGSGLWILMLQ